MTDAVKPEYIYGVISVIDRVVGRFLNTDGVIFKDDPAFPGNKRAYLTVLALTKEEALGLPRDITALATELAELADDLKHFIENHEFPNDPKEETSSLPTT